MNRLSVLFILILMLATDGWTGTINGVVRGRGKEGAEDAGGGGKYDSRKLKFVERVDYDELRDFVVYIEGPVGPKQPAPREPAKVITTRKISQKGAVFSPHVLPVIVGTTVEWPNLDDVFHNVFSMSEAKPFDLGLYKHPEIKRVTFDQPGRIDIFCSIHKAMNCIILVLENPYFAAADERGRYHIVEVPAGTYRLKAWHERLPSQTREIIVPESGDVRADFTLGIVNLPKY